MKAEPATNITVIRRIPTGSENTSTLALMNDRLPSGTREIQVIGSLPHGSAIRPASKAHARALRDWLNKTYHLED